MAQTLTQGQTLDGGIVSYDPNTGKPLKKGQTVTVQPVSSQNINPNAVVGSKMPQNATQTALTKAPPVITSKNADKKVSEATQEINTLNLAQKPKTTQEFNEALYDTMDESDRIAQDFQDQIASLQDGAIQYSPDEKIQLDAISTAVQNAAKAQQKINRQSERGTRLISGITGVGEFAPVRGMSALQQTIQTGLDNLRTIEVEGAAKLSEAKQAIRSNRFEEIVKSYDAVKENLKQRQDLLTNLRNQAFDLEKFEYQKMNDQREFKLKAAQANLQMEKLRQEINAGKISEANAQGLVDVVSGVNSLLDNTAGLKGAVGVRSLGRRGLFRKGAKQTFVGELENLTSGLTIEKLISSKGSGATFGALSEGEMKLLANSATKLNQWAKEDKNGNVIGWAVPESEVIKELNSIKDAAKVDYERRTGSPYPEQVAQEPTEEYQGIYLPGTAGIASGGDYQGVNLRF